MIHYVDPEKYTLDPCGSSSVPLWKAIFCSVPEGVVIVRDDAFTGVPEGYSDRVYFRLRHGLGGIRPLPVPDGCYLSDSDDEELAAQICSCYDEERITPDELKEYRMRPTYRPELWLTVRDGRTGAIAATGIAELDPAIREGVHEWIQVSAEHRRRGLGRFLVNELLYRMKESCGASFATVSGRADNPTDPFSLYKRCGFCDPVFWHIMTKAEK